ncbi:MAG: diacylglycerol kinase family lipid kinase [Ruminococcaceae bacterium]|nr:diacylglycerol kinase family lipid kinase [Oscillospiraceae bacterium]
MRYVFILNPKAGKGAAEQILYPRLTEYLEKSGLEWAIHRTEYRGHAEALAREEAMKGDPVRIYACGGDGTLNEVCSGAFPHPNAAVGVIPCGSGNDYIKSFPGNYDDLDAQINAQEVQADMIATDKGYSAGVASVGFDAEVGFNMTKFKRFVPGNTAYYLSVLYCLISKTKNRYTLNIDGERFQEVFLLTAIGNTSYYGGQFKALPYAVTDDGKLEVVAVRKLSRIKFLKFLKIYTAGHHLEDEALKPYIIYRQATEVTVSGEDPLAINRDGEITRSREATFRILPLAFRFLHPTGGSSAPVYAEEEKEPALQH